jgi:hypothetical protein
VTTLYPQKLALTLPTSGDRTVGIVRSRTKATELIGWFLKKMPGLDLDLTAADSFQIVTSSHLFLPFDAVRSGHDELFYTAHNEAMRCLHYVHMALVGALRYKLEGHWFETL